MWQLCCHPFGSTGTLHGIHFLGVAVIKDPENLPASSRTQKELALAKRLLEACADKPIRTVNTEYLGGIYRHAKPSNRQASFRLSEDDDD